MLKTKKPQYGFTLIELLVVTALIAMLAGATGGIYLSSYKRRLVEKTVRELFLTAKYARLIAIERQQPCKLVFRQSGTRKNIAEKTAIGIKSGFWLSMAQVDPITAEISELVIRNVYSKPVELPGDIKFEDIRIRPTEIREQQNIQEPTEIVFEPTGTANAATITLGDGRSRYTLTVSAATGRARIKFGPADEEMNDMVDLDL